MRGSYRDVSQSDVTYEHFPSSRYDLSKFHVYCFLENSLFEDQRSAQLIFLTLSSHTIPVNQMCDSARLLPPSKHSKSVYYQLLLSSWPWLLRPKASTVWQTSSICGSLRPQTQTISTSVPHPTYHIYLTHHINKNAIYNYDFSLRRYEPHAHLSLRGDMGIVIVQLEIQLAELWTIETVGMNWGRPTSRCAPDCKRFGREGGEAHESINWLDYALSERHYTEGTGNSPGNVYLTYSDRCQHIRLTGSEWSSLSVTAQENINAVLAANDTLSAVSGLRGSPVGDCLTSPGCEHVHMESS